MAPPLHEPLTYEEVMKVYRDEKKPGAGLSEIRKDFYPALRQLIEQLKKEHEKETASDPYSAKARSLGQQVNKLREKALQVFDFRAEKVMMMAIRTAGGGKLDTSRMTEEERNMLDGVLQKTNDCRQSIFGLQDKKEVVAAVPTAPTISPALAKPSVLEEAKPPMATPPPSKQPQPEHLAATKQERIEAVETSGPQASSTSSSDREKAPAKDLLLRILEDLPSFAGPEGTYKLHKEDVVSLPEAIGRTLVKRGKAEEIHPGIV